MTGDFEQSMVAFVRSSEGAVGPIATPRLHMQTLFRFNDEGLIVGTREPDAVHGPVFWIARGRDGCVWAVRREHAKASSART